MKYPLVKIIISITVITLSTCFSFANEISSYEYICRDLTGQQMWRASIERTNKSGDIYTIVEQGKGYSSVFNAFVSWKTKMDFLESKELIRPIDLVKQVFDEKGNMIRREKQNYDYKNGVVTCSHEDFEKNTSIIKKFKIKKDVVNRLLLSFYIKKFLNNGKTGASVQMLSEEPNIYNMNIKLDAIESISINGTQQKTYKMIIDPSLGALNIVKVFLPNSYSWFDADNDHKWLKFKGLEGGINTDKVEITLLN